MFVVLVMALVYKLLFPVVQLPTEFVVGLLLFPILLQLAPVLLLVTTVLELLLIVLPQLLLMLLLVVVPVLVFKAEKKKAEFGV